MPPSLSPRGRPPVVPKSSPLLLPLALGVLGACAVFPEPSGPYDHFSEASSLEVENNNWADMVISVRCGAMRKRLGTVSTNTRAVFTIPRQFNVTGGDVCFEADPVGSREVYASPEVVMTGGETFVWTIEEHTPLSTLVTR